MNLLKFTLIGGSLCLLLVYSPALVAQDDAGPAIGDIVKPESPPDRTRAPRDRTRFEGGCRSAPPRRDSRRSGRSMLMDPRWCWPI